METAKRIPTGTLASGAGTPTLSRQGRLAAL